MSNSTCAETAAVISAVLDFCWPKQIDSSLTVFINWTFHVMPNLFGTERETVVFNAHFVKKKENCWKSYGRVLFAKLGKLHVGPYCTPVKNVYHSLDKISVITKP